MSEVWVPRFVCPECREGASDGNGDGIQCDRCRLCFERHGGIYRFLTPQRLQAAALFAAQYRPVRERDGYRSTRPEYYRMLPSVASGDPQASVWRIRRESYSHLLQHALPAIWRGPIRVLDIGAGSGWMSHRLASFGHHVVAVDRLDDDQDGLGVCGVYPVSFAAVQADFDALPFEEGQFDLAVFNGSLHYSPDPSATLLEARRMLASDGVLAVVDSPTFADEEDGRAMVTEQRSRFARESGGVDDTGRGYLTFAGLERDMTSMGLHGSFVPSRGTLGWRVRRYFARSRLGREPASFGVLVAR